MSRTRRRPKSSSGERKRLLLLVHAGQSPTSRRLASFNLCARTSQRAGLARALGVAGAQRELNVFWRENVVAKENVVETNNVLARGVRPRLPRRTLGHASRPGRGCRDHALPLLPRSDRRRGAFDTVARCSSVPSRDALSRPVAASSWVGDGSARQSRLREPWIVPGAGRRREQRFVSSRWRRRARPAGLASDECRGGAPDIVAANWVARPRFPYGRLSRSSRASTRSAVVKPSVNVA